MGIIGSEQVGRILGMVVHLGELDDRLKLMQKFESRGLLALA